VADLGRTLIHSSLSRTGRKSPHLISDRAEIKAPDELTGSLRTLAVTTATTSAGARQSKRGAAKLSRRFIFHDSFLRNDSHEGVRNMRTNGRNGRNTRRPTFGGRKPNPILGAKRAAEFFIRIKQEYEDAADGQRLQLYKYAQRCFQVGLDFINDLNEFKRFMSDDFWINVRQKPKDDQIMKAVLTFTMNARTSRQQTKVTKLAKILVHLTEDQMAVGQVANYLKENGGIAGLYSQLTGDANKRKRVPDDLEILSLRTEEEEDEGEPEDEEEHDIRPEPDPEPDEEPEGIIEEPTAGHARAATRHARSNGDELAAALAASHVPKITDYGGVSTPPKAPSLRYRFDPDKHLALEMDPSTLAWVLSAPRRILIDADVGDEDETGWRSVKAVSVRRTPLIGGPRTKPEADSEDS
jgi:hypothetical protein